MSKPLCFVTGASGQLGRKVASILRHSLDIDTRAGSRTPADNEVHLDFDDDEPTLVEAFAGCERLVLISTDAFLVPGKRLAQHRKAVSAARKAGVGHILYTSMPHPDTDSPIPFAGDHRGTEEAIADAGIDATILRVGWYAELLLPALSNAVATGRWPSAAGDGRIAHIIREDAARAVAAAAIAPPGGVINLTGPTLRSTRDIAELASRLSGRPITVEAIRDDELHAQKRSTGLPPSLADVLVGFDRNTRLGRIAIVTDAIAKLTGTAARDLADFLEATRAQWIR